jgi:hypothetical protein
VCCVRVKVKCERCTVFSIYTENCSTTQKYTNTKIFCTKTIRTRNDTHTIRPSIKLFPLQRNYSAWPPLWPPPSIGTCCMAHTTLMRPFRRSLPEPLLSLRSHTQRCINLRQQQLYGRVASSLCRRRSFSRPARSPICQPGRSNGTNTRIIVDLCDYIRDNADKCRCWYVMSRSTATLAAHQAT